ncbi:P-loop containing nucleoside triphosphate hydrolase protein [Lophiotrema nucula]|uniref:P-loop containing nucleoside triphosphate hydrolase protein n=1 Tax=Lophiotrema nucula TaxID=690887 RepID=A0A6A5YTM1_9PLEO|nr:P-loop containing nucleoside triphosphate hydrolase protein [Lophiotrema nucula]
MSSSLVAAATTDRVGMILVMGVTGAGKSYFINKIAEGTVLEGRGLRSKTRKPQIVTAILGDDSGFDTEIAIVDTPGFDDTDRTDEEILTEISRFLAAEYLWEQFDLRGIVYLHRITDPRMQGSAYRYFKMFQSLCGEHAFKNVTLVTTMWDQLKDEAVGYSRDQELRNDFWSMMEDQGSQITTFDGSHEQAESIVLQLLGKPPVTLQLQLELVDYNRQLDHTTAGRPIAASLDNSIASAAREAEELSHQLRYATGSQQTYQRENLMRLRDKAEDDARISKHKRNRLKSRTGVEMKQKVKAEEKVKKSNRMSGKEAISMFASFLGLTVNLVFAILPLVGVM